MVEPSIHTYNRSKYTRGMYSLPLCHDVIVCTGQVRFLHSHSHTPVVLRSYSYAPACVSHATSVVQAAAGGQTAGPARPVRVGSATPAVAETAVPEVQGAAAAAAADATCVHKYYIYIYICISISMSIYMYIGHIHGYMNDRLLLISCSYQN